MPEEPEPRCPDCGQAVAPGGLELHRRLVHDAPDRAAARRQAGRRWRWALGLALVAVPLVAGVLLVRLHHASAPPLAEPPAFGATNQSAERTVLLLEDYDCPACRDAAAGLDLAALSQRWSDNGTLRLVVWPVPANLTAWKAQQASLCAWDAAPAQWPAWRASAFGHAPAFRGDPAGLVDAVAADVPGSPAAAIKQCVSEGRAAELLQGFQARRPAEGTPPALWFDGDAFPATWDGVRQVEARAAAGSP